MQSGSLNILKSWNKRVLVVAKKTLVYRILKYLYSFLKNIYYFLLRPLIGINASVKENDFKTLQVEFNDFDCLAPDPPVFKEFNPTYVMVKEKKIDCNVNVKNLENCISIETPNILYMNPITNKIKWIKHNLGFLRTVRNYSLSLQSHFHELNAGITALKIPKVSSFSYDDIKLSEKVRVTEEIITMLPYVKMPEKNLLFKVPVIKKPLFKSYFSEEEMNKFRESLAVQNKTKKTNVRILNIYDKFSVELFSSIKQEGNTQNLICYLNSKLTALDKNKLYYLLIGQRKDNQITIKSLASIKSDV